MDRTGAGAVISRCRWVWQCRPGWRKGWDGGPIGGSQVGGNVGPASSALDSLGSWRRARQRRFFTSRGSGAKQVPPVSQDPGGSGAGGRSAASNGWGRPAQTRSVVRTGRDIVGLFAGRQVSIIAVAAVQSTSAAGALLRAG